MTGTDAVRCSAPTVEHHRVPFGIDSPAPRVSWTTEAPSGWVQQAAQLEVTRHGRTEATAWLPGPDQVLVDWPGAPLASREQAQLRVRVRGTTGDSAWSEPVQVEAGLLEPADWTAEAVSPSWPEDPDARRRAPLLRRAFAVDREVVRARLYVTSHGLHEVELNGRRVGDDVLSPGWTSYPTRLRYLTHDVTDLVRAGENVLGAWLGDGWYRGRLGFHGGHVNLYGDRLALLAQLELTHADGSTTTVGTDPSWRATPGPVHCSGLLEGEVHDARDEPPGWSTPGSGDAGWSPVEVVPLDRTTLVATDAPPVRCTEERRPVSVQARDGGRLLLDFGQNLVGRLRVTVEGPAGHTLTLRHAEVLQDGELCTAPLRGATSTDRYVLRGSGPETWEPRFTVHGFRYAEVTGWTGGDPAAGVVARVLHTDMRRTGWFSCSDERVDQLHRNVVWSMRGNTVSLPTDCPQRDERLGWTGDIQVFGPTAAFLYDCSGLLSSWLRDVAAEQLPDGTVPWYVPVVPGGPEWTPIRPGAAWGDAAVLLPWALYQAFGDAGLLARQFDSARAWVDLVASLAGPTRLWDQGFQLGDWLDPAAPPDDPAAGLTDRYLIATAHLAWSARHVARMAGVLARPELELEYGELAAEVAAAWRAAYTRPDGRLTSDTQTAYALALEFDLLDGADARAAAGRRLADLAAAAGHRVTTGFVGTPLLTRALSATGHLDDAYALLEQRECPSWLYAVEMGATTVWERWDSLLPDGTVNPGGMTSFNHYALGAVAEWLHTTVAGLRPTAPGWREIEFRPSPGGSLRWAEAAHDSPYGRVAVRWELADGELVVDTTVPIGATARLVWPDGTALPLVPGRHTARHPHPSPGDSHR